jgi:hypothetical protein
MLSLPVAPEELNLLAEGTFLELAVDPLNPANAGLA